MAARQASSSGYWAWNCAKVNLSAICTPYGLNHPLILTCCQGIHAHKSRRDDPLLAHRAAVSAHFVYERAHRLDRRTGGNPMSEVEDVSGLRAERVQHFACCASHLLRIAEKRGRIEVSLQRDALAGELARAARIGLPVEPDRVVAARHDGLEPRRAAFREEHGRDAPALALAHEPAQHLARI